MIIQCVCLNISITIPYFEGCVAQYQSRCQSQAPSAKILFCPMWLFSQSCVGHEAFKTHLAALVFKLFLRLFSIGWTKYFVMITHWVWIWLTARRSVYNHRQDLEKTKPETTGDALLHWRKRYYGLILWIKNVLMLDLFQLLSSPDVNWWTGVLWIIVMFLLLQTHWLFPEMFIYMIMWRNSLHAVPVLVKLNDKVIFY